MIKKLLKNISIGSFYVFFIEFLNSKYVYADNITVQSPFGTTDFQTYIQALFSHVLDIVFFLTGLIFVSMIIYSGIMYMLDYGSDQKIKSAKKILTNSLIGTVIIGFAGMIIKIIEILFNINLGL